jgi:hypothetical protein
LVGNNWGGRGRGGRDHFGHLRINLNIMLKQILENMFMFAVQKPGNAYIILI